MDFSTVMNTYIIPTVCGVGGAGATVVYQYLTGRSERKAAHKKLDHEIAIKTTEAAQLAGKVVRRDALEEWQRLCQHYEDRSNKLADWNARQQVQINVLSVEFGEQKSIGEHLKQQHAECVDKHEDCEQRVRQLEGRIAKIEKNGKTH